MKIQSREYLSIHPQFVWAWTWSSSNLLTIDRKATKPAAARIPACRIPPPNCLRIFRDLAMNSADPHKTEPTGAHNPFDKQNMTESADSANFTAVVLKAIAALKIRAPSTCNFIPKSWARSPTECIYSTESGMPPQAFWVFSMITSL